MSDVLERRYRFRAKRYGIGWGLPLTWEGWVVLCIFIAALLGAPVFTGDSSLALGAVVVTASLVLLAVCWWKGEACRWRWGKE